MTDKKIVLDTLSHATGSRSAFSLAISAGIPEPSVRRIIHELRRSGRNIETLWSGYRLRG